MSNLIPGNQKHLTLDNSVFIEKCLDQESLNAFKLREISPDDIILTPDLIK